MKSPGLCMKEASFFVRGLARVFGLFCFLLFVWFDGGWVKIVRPAFCFLLATTAVVRFLVADAEIDRYIQKRSEETASTSFQMRTTPTICTAGARTCLVACQWVTGLSGIVQH